MALFQLELGLLGSVWQYVFDIGTGTISARDHATRINGVKGTIDLVERPAHAAHVTIDIIVGKCLTGLVVGPKTIRRNISSLEIIAIFSSNAVAADQGTTTNEDQHCYRQGVFSVLHDIRISGASISML